VTAPPSSEEHRTAGARDRKQGYLGNSCPVRRVLPIALAGFVLAGCHGTSRTQAHFCDSLRKGAPVLSAAIASPGAADIVVQEFVALGKVTPLAIEDDWNTLADLVQTADTMDLADPAAQSALATKVFAADAATKNVLAYAKDRCGVDLSGDIPANATTSTTTATTATPPTSAG
jgi:hypothetical protein